MAGRRKTLKKSEARGALGRQRDEALFPAAPLHTIVQRLAAQIRRSGAVVQDALAQIPWHHRIALNTEALGYGE